MTWWGGKVRQAVRHATGRVSDGERAALEAWLTPAQVDLFGRMHRADRRHGLDVVAALRAQGRTEPELLLAGLFHDASKGPGTRLVHRVTWSLGERYGPWVWRLARPLPTFATALDRMASHAVDSALLAQAAGCPDLTAELIRHQARPRDPVLGDALLVADEAS